MDYRSHGAVNAAKYGGIASLARSATGSSIYSPHTGMQDYEDGVPQVPAACITVEDAEMFQRMQDRGQFLDSSASALLATRISIIRNPFYVSGDKIVLKLYMEAQNYPAVVSRNTIVETVGQTNPEEVS